jgi:predicted short-subunit dehydrogenase-like oxidoreductase (DUF2520 family)
MGKLSFIGTGNLSWHLSQAFFRAGHTIVEFCGRQPEKTRGYAARVDAQPIDHPSLMDSDLDFIFICVSDSAIAEVSSQLNPSRAILVHCSGSTPLNHLKGEKTAVFYPFQSFRTETGVRWRELNILLEGNTLETTEALFNLASCLGSATQATTEQDRQRMHLAGVLASNFVNLLWQKAQELCMQSGMDPELLHPLMEETLNKAVQMGCTEAQTGPALRRDNQTLMLHENMLKMQPPWDEVYRTLSQEIAKRHPLHSQP